MAVIQKLKYREDDKIVRKGGTDTWNQAYLPSYSRGRCPYCGEQMRGTEEMIVPNKYDWMDCESDVYKYRCSGCGWWWEGEFPNKYGSGYSVKGILNKSRACQKLHGAISAINSEINSLYKMDPTYFEKFVGEILSSLYACEVIHTGRSHDGGVDLILIESNEGKIPIQVKRRGSAGKVESVSLIREFRGAMLLQGYNKGIIVTLADHFSKSAIAASKPSKDHLVQQNIDLIDCRRLLDILNLIRH